MSQVVQINPKVLARLREAMNTIQEAAAKFNTLSGMYLDAAGFEEKLVTNFNVVNGTFDYNDPEREPVLEVLEGGRIG